MLSSPARLFIWVFAAQRSRLIAGLMFGAVGVAAAELSLPWLLHLAVDTTINDRDIVRLDKLGLAMLAVIVMLYVMHALMLRFETKLMQEGMFRLRRELYARILAQPLSFFANTRTGSLMHRVVNDTAVLERHAAYLMSDLPFELITIVGVVTAMVLLEPRLGCVVVGFLFIASCISSYLGRSLPSLRKRAQNASAAFSERIQEIFSGIRTVKTFACEDHEIARLEGDNTRLKRLEQKTGRVEAILEPVFDLMELLGIVFIVWYGAHLILQDRLSVGGLIAFIAYMELLAGPIGNAGKYYRHFIQCRAISERLGEFLDSVAPSAAVGRRDTPCDAPVVTFDNLRFCYPGSERRVLDGLTFEIPAGETVALVGANGSGKSTLLDLLLRFQEPIEGRITVGGVDLAELDPQAWRDAVGTMSQEALLFHATVRDNIAYGRSAATDEDVRDAAAAAGLNALLARLPEGLNTMVGDRGCQLSGGERQRIALARLFLKDPKILILDEPTTYLDAKAIREVKTILARLARGRTTFLVEHHSEVLSIAHRRIVLEGGRLIQSGPQIGYLPFPENELRQAV